MNSLVNSIHKILDQLGLTAQKRAIHIQFTNTDLNQHVYLQRIDGQHALNQGVSAELICLSTSATIPLKQFIGTQVAIDQVTDAGQLFRTTGIITEAAQGQSDGSLTIYKLKLQDATSLWHKRRNSRVFMNKSAVEVIETIFKEWQDKSPLFASSLSLDKSGLKKDYDIRPFIMQSNESDYDFLTRLMRSEGINWLIDEAQLQVPNSATQIQAQKLRLIDDNSQYKALDRRNIRYHRSSATEKQDSITSFIGQRSLQPTAVHVQRWQADVLEQEEGAGSVQSKHQHSNNQDNASLGLEQAWHISPAWMQDLNGEDQATTSNNGQIEKLNQNLSDYYNSQSKQFIANSTVRDAQVGYWFKFTEHPEIDQHSGSDQEFLIIEKNYYNQNNLPKDLTEQITKLLEQSNWLPKNSQLNTTQKTNNSTDNTTEERQANSLTIQRRNINTVPEYNPLRHRPSTHPQRAKVVGPSGEEIHVDEWGRIKVRFLFTRTEDHGHDGGAGTNDNDTDSVWVDVLTPWAGEGYGARFLPRIGEIVVIDFFDGNIDRPFVVGRIHEAQRSPTQFDKKGQLPDTKKLAGIRSKEYKGEGFGQLRFDDTTGQISTQLQNSHGASQLNLGNLSHPKGKDSSDGRGEGFELRTDQWGAVRAGQGLLLSTYKQDQASGTHLDAKEAKQQLENSLNNSKALSEVAKNQQTDPLEVIDNLSALLKGLEVSKVAAITNLVGDFKSGLTSNPLGTLGNLGGFVEKVGGIKGDVKGVIQQFNDSFKDVKQTIQEFEGFVKDTGQQLENYKDQFQSLRSGLSENPFKALKDAKGLFSDIQKTSNQVQSIVGFAKQGLSNPLEGFKGLSGFMDNLSAKSKSDAKSQAEFKIFQDAMMVLAAPNSIAVTSNEDIHISADQQIYETAGDSIQYSTQKNLIAHAQSKISLFAAQDGARFYAGKGKVEIQAQGDGADLIARKGVQVISTEDKIEIKANKKIVLIAGGSQIEISSGGVLPTTPAKFEVKAGQHKFVGGAKVDVKIEEMPMLGLNYLSFFATDKTGNKLPSGTGYVLYGADGSIVTGKLSEDGYIKTPPSSEPKEYTIIIDDPRFDTEEKNIEDSE
ncbi:type VI secretion system Vgr family protein [Acinetobacter wuhouensis]|uniref:Type VI secretion system tip protein VgrG n=1 Tax=Acinetobacter wuhouensis TaxID=1879050 RepID=A0A3G2T628_9GAMM|nr:type VI secretion system Vgr family protein [Acinetobacter wuhouensis]AYO55763.1 type VI secretion system tip protein VgrG [Acinetobacter wuhouensis]